MSKPLSIALVAMLILGTPGLLPFQEPDDLEGDLDRIIIDDVPPLGTVPISSEAGPGLIGSTYLKGSGIEDVIATTLDNDGNVYVVGGTMSDDLPVTPGVWGRAWNLGLSEARDGFIALFDPNCTELLACTYFGGEARDIISDIVVLPDGDIVVAGFTNSTWFPTTADAMNFTTNGGSRELFLAKFSGDLKERKYCTYFGGGGHDSLPSISLGTDGSIYMTAITNSTDIPVSQNAYMGSRPGSGDTNDVVAAKFNSSLKELDYCTYLGGSLDERCPLNGIGPSGKLVVAFTTESDDIETSPSSYDDTLDGTNDTVVTILSTDGGETLRTTYFGGDDVDIVAGITVDSHGQVYITGMTNSSVFPVTTDAVQKNRMDIGLNDAFLTVFAPTLDGLVYSSIVGGDQSDLGFDIVLGSDEQLVFLTGMTASQVELIRTEGCYAIEYSGGDTDYYLYILNMSTRTTEYATYYGGSGYEDSALPAHVLDVDDEGHAYLAMDTTSDDLPMRTGAYCSTFDGGRDAALVRINPQPCTTLDSPDVDHYEGNGYINVSWDVSWYECCQVLEVVIERGMFADGPDNVVMSSKSLNDTYHDKYSTTNGFTWHYWVSVVNTAGKGTAYYFNATPIGPPEPPQYFEARSGDGQVDLNWSVPDDWGGGIDRSLRLYRKEVGGDWAQIGSVLGEDQQEYRDEDELELGMFYVYSIEAWNELYNSTWGYVRVQVYEPPSAPTDVEGHPGDGNITLMWKAPASTGGIPLHGYNVYSREGVGNWSGPVTRGANETWYNHTHIKNAQGYSYRISAFNLIEGPWFETEEQVPFGVPTVPMNLTHEEGIETITLYWDPPEFDNGSTVTTYTIQYGSDLEGLSTNDTTDDEFWIHPRPDPGVTYTYQVRANNERGPGPPCTTMATTYGLPGPPSNPAALNTSLSVRLSWDEPVESGGDTSLLYKVQRKVDDGTWGYIDDLIEGTEYEDTDVRGGSTYRYKVQTVNDLHTSEESSEVQIRFTRTPGPVWNANVEVRSGYLLVTWNGPNRTGGHEIVRYNITRMEVGGGTYYNDNIVTTRFEDRGVFHNQTYTYIIRARNSGFSEWGDEHEMSEVTVVGRLGTVQNLTVDTKGDDIVLAWDEPEVQEFVEVQGYKVYRGLTPQIKHLVATLGVVDTWTDTQVQPDTTYHYLVVAYHQYLTGEEGTPTSHSTPPEVTEPSDISWYIPLIIVVLLVVLGLAYIVASRRRRTEDVEGPEPEPEDETPLPPWERPTSSEAPLSEAPTEEEDGVPIVPLTPLPPDGILPYLVEEVFVVYNDGRLITSCAREECGTPDADLMSGMLIAIQGLIQDGLERGGTLESIKYGENLISLATGDHVVLAAVVYGKPGEELPEALRTIVANIEGVFGGVIEDWSGDPSELEDLESLVMPLIERTSVMTRDDVGEVLADKAVALMSAVDFYRGYVRLKMAAVNATRETIIESAIEIHYDSDMLRLERVEPSTIVMRGDRVRLGNVLPGERKTVGLLFDPQICQGTHLDGHLSYYDSRGELQYVEMKRRHADVVCPVFFTRETANTAMLRRLMRERLHQSDIRVYRYPQGIAPGDVLAIGKQALGSDEVQLVREYIVNTPSYEAEVWYYAETKVKRYQFVIRLGVVEDKGVLELFAASTAMQPVTGLLAEFRRELDLILRERYAEEARMEVERDEQLRRDLERRPLMLEEAED